MFAQIASALMGGEKQKPEFEKNVEHVIYIDTEGKGGWLGGGGGISRETYDTFVEQYRHYAYEDDLVIHIRTEGGSLTYATLIANIVAAHGGKTTARVTRYAMSGGTLIALACDALETTRYATLGGIDPQSSMYGSVRNVVPHLENWMPSTGTWASLFRDVSLETLSEMDRDFRTQLARIFEQRYPTEVLEFFTKQHAHSTPLLHSMLPAALNVALYTEPTELDRMRPLTEKQIRLRRLAKNAAEEFSNYSDDDEEEGFSEDHETERFTSGLPLPKSVESPEGQRDKNVSRARRRRRTSNVAK